MENKHTRIKSSFKRGINNLSINIQKNKVQLPQGPYFNAQKYFHISTKKFSQDSKIRLDDISTDY